MNVSKLGLTRWTERALVNGGIQTVDELIELSQSDLLQIKHIGHSSIEEITQALATKGLSLATKSRVAIDGEFYTVLANSRFNDKETKFYLYYRTVTNQEWLIGYFNAHWLAHYKMLVKRFARLYGSTSYEALVALANHCHCDYEGDESLYKYYLDVSSL